jgi:GAF domain-containing protein
MTPERLARILAAYGASPERWPRAERADALALLARDMDAARHAAALDGALDGLAVPHPDAAMVGRALAGFAEAAPGSLLRRWWFAPLLAGAGALGMAAGALLLALTPLERRSGWLDEHTTIFSAAPGDMVDPAELSL